MPAYKHPRAYQASAAIIKIELVESYKYITTAQSFRQAEQCGHRLNAAIVSSLQYFFPGSIDVSDC